MLLLLALLVGGSAAAQPTPVPEAPGVRHIELAEDGDHPAHEVVIRPGLTTAFRFHGAVIDRETVTLQGRERPWVSIADESILLVPSEKAVPGQRLRLTVPFKGDVEPASVTFTLVVHAAEAERQVEVYRQRRPSESLRAELREKDARIRECHEQMDRLHAGRKHPGGLSALIAAGHMDGEGVAARELTGGDLPQPGEALEVRTAWSYRSARRVAVELWLEVSEGAGPWNAERARLRSGAGEELTVLSVWQDDSVSTGAARRVIVEADSTKNVAHVPFVLTLWGEDGRPPVTLSNVTFL
nr:DUF2381 family protein [Myxococcus sp. RHSTA-1-4]